MAVWTSAGISGGHVNPAVSHSVHKHNPFSYNNTFEDNVGVCNLARFPLEKSPWYVYPETLHYKFELNILNFKYSFLVYIFAQVMGGVVGAGLVYSQYIRAIDIVEGGRNVRTQATASFFSSYAVSIQTTCSYSWWR